MNILPILCLLIPVNILNANPIATNDYFKTLTAKCSIINNDVLQTAMMQQGMLKKCTNWTKIDQTENLSRATEDNVRCLLYFESLVSFCGELKTANIHEIKSDILVPDLKYYKVDNFCKNLSSLLTKKKLEHNIRQLIPNERICEKVCTTYEDTISVECSLAHYFVTFNVTVLTHLEHTLSGSQPNLSIMAHLPKTDLPEAGPAQVGTQVVSQIGNIQESASQGNVSAEGALQTKHDSEVSVSNLHSENINNSSIIKNLPKDEDEKLGSGAKNIFPADQVAASGTGKIETLSSQNAAVSLVKNATTPLVKDGTASSIKNGTVSSVKDGTASPVKDGTASSVKDGTASSVKNGATHEKKGNSVEQTNAEENNLDTDSDENSEQPDINEVEGDKDDNPYGANQEEIYANSNKDGELDGDKDDTHKDKEQNEVADKKDKPDTVGSSPVNENTEDLSGESYFFSYFMVICVLFILGYVGYHNKQKVLALVLEGKRGKRQYRGRRPNSANYHKLDSNLEEAISSTCTKNSSHVIY